MKRNEIIEKTHELIFIRYEDVTFRKIANELNISLGSINYHFASKENLLVEAVQLQMSNILNGLDESSATVSDLTKILMIIFNDIKKIRQNHLLASEVIRAIQSSILPNQLSTITKIFSNEYSGVNEIKSLVLVLAVQQLAMNQNLNNNTIELDFSSEQQINNLIKQVLN